MVDAVLLNHRGLSYYGRGHCTVEGEMREVTIKELMVVARRQLSPEELDEISSVLMLWSHGPMKEIVFDGSDEELAAALLAAAREECEDVR